MDIGTCLFNLLVDRQWLMLIDELKRYDLTIDIEEQD